MRGVALLSHVEDGGGGEGGGGDGGGAVSMYGWVFPVTVPGPERASRMLLKLGYNAPLGEGTQLWPINDIIVKKEEGGDRERRRRCPHMSYVFDCILYLPMTCKLISSMDCPALINALAAVIASSNDEDDHSGGDLIED